MPERELIEGRNPVLETLKAGRKVYRIWLQSDARGETMGEIRKLAAEQRVPIEEVEGKTLIGRSQTGYPQGVIAQVEAWKYASVEQILARAEQQGEAPFLLLLDGLEDPQNFGSLIRTAETAGVHGIIITEHRAVGLTPAVARASAGAVAYMPIARVTNLVRTMEELKEQGIWFAGADPQGVDFWKSPIDWRGPFGLIIGGEGKGIGRLVKEHCDALVRLPMRGKVSSLNASVAGAILMYEAVRNRLIQVQK
ncbi:MAG TPA: 23S rRNA (guanosine(2251)-2'-O)-methyltransferase RlmB [Bacillota bacterium]|nr:23S rRNA (guanosine(2251)-2'-O)-methyltransferase RlmB [Bacillota bacterium]